VSPASVRDLRVYANSFGAELYHYQDYKNQEFDAVIELPDKRWCGIEIKLGAHQIDGAAENLLRINSAISKSKGNPASCMVVVCGLGNAAYKRPDGVFVVQITILLKKRTTFGVKPKMSTGRCLYPKRRMAPGRVPETIF